MWHENHRFAHSGGRLPGIPIVDFFVMSIQTGVPALNQPSFFKYIYIYTYPIYSSQNLHLSFWCTNLACWLQNHHVWRHQHFECKNHHDCLWISFCSNIINHLYLPISARKILGFCKTPLVGGFNPSEKYEFVSWDDDIPNIWKVISNSMVPNHQSVV